MIPVSLSFGYSLSETKVLKMTLNQNTQISQNLRQLNLKVMWEGMTTMGSMSDPTCIIVNHQPGEPKNPSSLEGDISSHFAVLKRKLQSCISGSLKNPPLQKKIFFSTR